ncbi:MAG: prepilin-type N-terminal cleavage/methylation domain-containing protein [Phycisphaerales bacterium]|jgi:prepilin-type N-terminal cleavage/methylation domain-containing protein|nr:prepilin-type N-terminal cleavage/methylation domain-containing protein [Phycisphaerales bacterium]
MLTRTRTRRAFTLIELLVVIAIIALLVGILLPSLGSARESARMAKCASNLRSLGIAAMTHANDRRGAFSTGPWDNRIEYSAGSLRTHGWVADFVNGGYARPGDVLCPSSPGQASQNLSLARMSGGSMWAPLTADLVNELIDEGFNTNYCQSWFMGMTDARTPNQAGNLKQVATTVGPLRADWIVNTATSKVPLFGDGTADLTQVQDTIAYRGQQIRGAKALSDGPATGRVGTLTGWARQDYSDFGPVHGKGGFVSRVGHDRQYGQIVFADGNVQSFSDLSPRDGEFASSGIIARDNIIVSANPELDSKVFGGWLRRPGLPF